MEGPGEGTLEASLQDREPGERIGVLSVVEGDESQAVDGVKTPVGAVNLITKIEQAHADGSGFHMIEAAQAPGSHGQLPDEDFLAGSGGGVLGFEGIDEGFKVGHVFAVEGKDLGGEPVLDAVEADGGAAFGSFRTGTFPGVGAVGGDLFLGGHGYLLIGFAGESRIPRLTYDSRRVTPGLVG